MPLCALQQVPQKLHETKASQLSTSRFVLPVGAAQGPLGQVRKQPSVPWQGLVSVLNALKKLRRFPTMEHVDPVAEGDEEFKLFNLHYLKEKYK
jgi:hypothetical protein